MAYKGNRPAFRSVEGSQASSGTIHSNLFFGGGKDYVKEVNPDGTIKAIETPRSEGEVDRYRGLADSYGKRGAYQLDWDDANKERQRALQARNRQTDAANIWANRAGGNNFSAYQYGVNAINRGINNQRAIAGSVRGGPLAQMAARRNTATGEAAFRSQGMANMRAAQAGEMADARQNLVGALSDQRTQDQHGQSLGQEQSKTQAESELAQRGLNDQGRMGFEKLGYDVNKQVLDSQLRATAANQARIEANRAAQEAKESRAIGAVNAGVSMVGGAAFSDKRAKKAAYPLLLKVGNRMLREHEGQTKTALEAGPSVRDRVAEEREDVDFIKRKGPSLKELAAEARRDRARESYDVDFIKGLPLDSRAQTTREPERGVTGAPKGYAESRRGQAGYMFGDGAAKNWDDEHGMGAGTYDVLKYGTPSKRSESRMDEYSKAVMTSGMTAKNAVSSRVLSPGKAKNPVDPELFGDLSDDKLRIGEDHHAFQAEDRPDTVSGASLSGPTPKFSSAPDKPAPAPKAKSSGKRKMTDDELMAWANSMLGETNTQKNAQLGAGPSVGYRPLMLSDDKTKVDRYKREAFAEGVQFGFHSARGEQEKATQPEYTKVPKKEVEPGAIGVGPFVRPKRTDAEAYEEGVNYGLNEPHAKRDSFEEGADWAFNHPSVKRDGASEPRPVEPRTEPPPDMVAAARPPVTPAPSTPVLPPGIGQLLRARLLSDEKTKSAQGGRASLGSSETVEQRKAREAEEDRIATEKFMGTASETPEDRKARQDKEAFEAREADRTMRKELAQKDRDQRIKYVDARMPQDRFPESYRNYPILRALKAPQLTDDEKAAAAPKFADVERDKKEAKEKAESAARSLVGEKAWSLAERASASLMSAPPKVRQPESFTRERPEEERTLASSRVASDKDTKSARGSKAMLEMVASGNRHLEGYPYTYKEGYGEDTKQLHFGPNADDLEKHPVTRTALRYGEDGTKMLDKDDIDRLSMSGIGALQKQHDMLKREVEALKQRRA